MVSTRTGPPDGHTVVSHSFHPSAAGGLVAQLRPPVRGGWTQPSVHPDGSIRVHG